jgi:hypothetical protein
MWKCSQDLEDFAFVGQGAKIALVEQSIKASWQREKYDPKKKYETYKP